MKYISEIHEQGYTLIKATQNPKKLLNRIKELKPFIGDDVPYLNQSSDMVYNLQNKDFIFVEAALRHPEVNQILTELLNDHWYKNINPNYILRSMVARSGGPEALPLHLDSFIPSSGKHCWSAQVMFVLEDMNYNNGCTLVIPSSHLWDEYANKNDVLTRILQRPVMAEAGDILIWDSRLHHGTTSNTSGKSRWAFISTFTRWWIKQNYQIPRMLPIKTYHKLTNQEKAIMGYCSIPPINETDRIDIKAGYEVLV